ncbi:GH15 family glucan-1,4-alpha-glucosidase [Brevibacterium sanguinis]|uniref:GH15 family glucan-1,4-alpha-glucosidase n=2 Tax=Brevibacterium TaxID=1696 RepID=A0A366INV2_9MICO|nr:MULTISPECIES: glycoside hydrolase family 15 protein [Brevibacterium]RBP67159.1 GH15 family glucan-1,4-alpha-glucosidase [Brevibacterium sanguinis]RBP73684.1 GH15 family glucan-1,4-alpha-glucosidase [Brevibacterium celere]
MGDEHADCTPLEDYALLSDLRTGPLLSREGSIDWLCLPRFDSPAVFSALLGEPDDGRWLLRVVDGAVVSRRYLPRTFVVETVWQSPTGRARVLDFMPLCGDNADLIRSVECTEGTVTIEHDLRIRFDYNRAKPWTRKIALDGSGAGGLLSVSGPNALLLTGPELHPDRAWQERHSCADPSDADCAGDAGPEDDGSFETDDDVEGRPDDYQGAVPDRLTGEFGISAGESLDWVLTWHPSYHESPAPADPHQARDEVIAYWRGWSKHVEVRSRHDELVLRSLLVLRALTDRATGGIVAAPTTSLPEYFGGERNWDYRFTWLRDASLTIGTLISHGFTEGALHWRDWLLRAVAGDPDDVQIMYGVAGERNLTEFELPHLAGYAGSRPVRIGNGASLQYQADVVGEVMLALAALRDAGKSEDEFSWGLQKNLLRFLEHNFDRKGHGIWEMRGTPDYFTHGRAMMFAAFDQGVRAVEEHGLPGPTRRWRDLRSRLREEIFDRGFDAQSGSFTQTYSNTEVDASLLQLPFTGLVAPDDPAMLGTVARIEEDLIDSGGMVRRYRTESGVDGLPGGEYSFLMCTFWLIEQYALSGRRAEAEELLERTVGFATDLGLLAEEYDEAGGRLAGNFPQAFSHLGLIRAVDAVTGVDRSPRTATD